MILPAAALAIALGFALADPRCGSPADSGGCAMGLATVALAAVVPGFVLFAAITLIRGLKASGRLTAIAAGARRRLRRTAVLLRRNRR